MLIRPIAVGHSVFHRFPSLPLVMASGLSAPVEYSVIDPPGVIFPMVLPMFSVNQRLPSGPLTISCGNVWISIELPVVGYSWTTPVDGFTLPMFPSPASTNHTLPSGPLVIPSGNAFTASG